VGVGDPLEASFVLLGAIGAGTWHLVGDGLVLAPVDMRFDVLLAAGGVPEQTVVSFSHHFDPPTGAHVYDAVTFEADAAGAAVAARPGDLLVLRLTAVQSTTGGAAFIPNADGSHAAGRIPSLTVP
jgi:hypothetical protein